MLSKSMTILSGILWKNPLNGYELVKKLSVMEIKHWYNIAESTVYASIKMLEKKGNIEGKIEKKSNMPPKTIYTLTLKGETELTETIREYLQKFSYDTVDFTIGVFFMPVIGKQEFSSIIEVRCKYLQKYTSHLSRQYEEISKQKLPENVLYGVKYSLDIALVNLENAQKILKSLQKHEGDYD
jgi:DNA-binding PadR family transcriptional regulator